MPDNFFAETEQVAFMTQNVPPGIDFSNDPLLQGRNFSYLDTQLKRLGSPNFTHLPINAPKCPFAPFPAGRAHGDAQSGRARQLPAELVRRRPARISEARLHAVRGRRAGRQSAGCAPESFADHYSQARQFFISQTRGEQHHIAAALTFELSKVKTPVIRERMVSHLLNIDETLANKVGTGLGLESDAEAGRCGDADAAGPDPSPKLSIVENGPQRFEGRKLGILVTDGTDAAL